MTQPSSNNYSHGVTSSYRRLAPFVLISQNTPQQGKRSVTSTRTRHSVTYQSLGIAH
jgi:hypothetical protein